MCSLRMRFTWIVQWGDEAVVILQAEDDDRFPHLYFLYVLDVEHRLEVRLLMLAAPDCILVYTDQLNY